MTGLFSLFKKQKALNSPRDQLKKRKFHCDRCGFMMLPAGNGLFVCPACGFRKHFY